MNTLYSCGDFYVEHFLLLFLIFMLSFEEKNVLKCLLKFTYIILWIKTIWESLSNKLFLIKHYIVSIYIAFKNIRRIYVLSFEIAIVCI